MALQHPLTQAAVPAALARVAFFSETHSVKGLLALDRLAARYALHDASIGSLLELNQLLATPRVEGLLSDACRWDASTIDEKRIRSMVDLPVFPIAYLAAVEWVRRRGIRDLVDTYRGAAARNLDFLGHAWTIWCSFHELVRHVSTDHERALFAERFAELVAVQLCKPRPEKLPPIDPPATNDDVAVRLLSLRHPGYLAHTTITAAYLYRHRALLDAAEWRSAMHVVHRMAASHETSTYAGTLPSYDGPVDEATFGRVVREALEHGPREVHTLTALDALHDLWALGDEATRRGTIAVATYLRDLDFQRAASGERKK